MMYFFKILLSIIAGIAIGAIVAFIMILLGVLGVKFLDWLCEKFRV